MAWFSFRPKTPQLHIVENEIKQCPVNLSPELKEMLQQLNFEERWALTKRLLPILDKTKARNLVRFCFAESPGQVFSLLEKHEEMAAVIECLSYFPSRETVEMLVNLLNHINEQIQILAAGALMNHTPRLVVPIVMEKFLKAEVPAPRAGEILLGMGYLAQDALLDAYQEAAEEVKAQILELLAASRNPKCRQFLPAALVSECPNLKKAALQAVAVFQYTDLWSEVAANLDDPAWQIRTKALEVLSRLEAGEALGKVIPLVHDEDPWVRKQAESFVQKWGIMNKAGEGEQHVE